MSLRNPERLFAAGGWLLSLLFASFLLGIGSSVIRELPGVDRSVRVEAFIDRTAQRAIEQEESAAAARVHAQTERLAAVEREVQQAEAAYSSAKDLFDNWLAARATTARSDQDPEVLARTKGLDSLRGVQQAAAARAQTERDRVRDLEAARQTVLDRLNALETDATPQYLRAKMAMEMKIFIFRLLLTLPLLVAAAWMVRRKRADRLWPLYRGFVIFATVAFFVELVPYLPSYGGYVRNTVGIIATLAGARWLAQAMQRYQAKRLAAQQQPEEEKRRHLDGEIALGLLGKGQCPGCSRPIEGGIKATQNFCGHCAMHLFHTCSGCKHRQTTFLPFCIQCGVSMEGASSRSGTPVASAQTSSAQTSLGSTSVTQSAASQSA